MDETELEVKVLWPCWMMCVSGPELEGPAGVPGGASEAAFLWGRALGEGSCGLVCLTQGFSGSLGTCAVSGPEGCLSQVILGVFDSETQVSSICFSEFSEFHSHSVDSCNGLPGFLSPPFSLNLG